MNNPQPSTPQGTPASQPADKPKDADRKNEQNPQPGQSNSNYPGAQNQDKQKTA